MAALQPSPRLVRAVAAERAELERHRARLIAEAQELRASLERIQHGLTEIEERRTLLERLAPQTDGEPQTQTQNGGALRGPAIRETAVKVLLAGGGGPLHYREWFELLLQNGHEIAGKDPLAVFLTQISRSPIVRRGSHAGVYELDRQAPQRLRSRIDALRCELRRTGSMELTREIRRQERALEEASRLLSHH